MPKKVWHFAHMSKMTLVRTINAQTRRIGVLKATITKLTKKLEEFNAHIQIPSTLSLPPPSDATWQSEGWLRRRPGGFSPETVRDKFANEIAAKRCAGPCVPWSNYFISLAFVLYATSARAYRYVKRLIRMPAVSTIYERIGPRLNLMKSNLGSLTSLSEIVTEWQISRGIDPDLVIDAVLGCDAAKFQDAEINGLQCTDCFAFLVMPLNPTIPTFVVHLCPHTSGSMKEGINYCTKVVEVLHQKSNIRIRSIATDGDRAYMKFQENIFWSYFDDIQLSLDEICTHLFCKENPELWWIGDLLHALKCQRCRLEKHLFLVPGHTIHCSTLNLKLNLRNALTEAKMRGVHKMNDVFAIELFSMDNLIRLLSVPATDIDFDEIEYLMPFVLWYYAISVDDLSRRVRLDLLAIAFRIFVRWASIRIPEPPADGVHFLSHNQIFGFTEGLTMFFTEAPDLARYMNTIVFVYQTIRGLDDVALNRLGTHPVENFFGLVRVTCHYTHTWDRILSAVAKASISADVLAAHGLREHIRRDFSLAGAKANYQSDDKGKRDVEGLLCHGMDFVDLFLGHNLNNVKPVLDLWLQDLTVLAEWNNWKNRIRIVCPGPVANQSIINRLFGFGRGSKRFKWTKRKRQVALALGENPELSYADISRRIGCAPADVEMLLTGEIKSSASQVQ